MLHVSLVEFITCMNETLRMDKISVNPQRNSELLNRTKLKENMNCVSRITCVFIQLCSKEKKRKKEKEEK